MEIEQRYVVNYLCHKEMKLSAILAELAVVYHEDAFDENRVKYELHEIKLHRSDLSDRPGFGRPLLKRSMLDGTPLSHHFSQHEKPPFQIGSSFS
jgi:hypothetical protein